MGDRCLQAVLVLGLNGVRLLNKEQVVHHDEMCIRDRSTGVGQFIDNLVLPLW